MSTSDGFDGDLGLDELARAATSASSVSSGAQGSPFDVSALMNMANHMFRGGYDEAPVGALPGLPAEQVATQVPRAPHPAPYAAVLEQPVEQPRYQVPLSQTPYAQTPQPSGDQPYYLAEAQARAQMRDADTGAKLPSHRSQLTHVENTRPELPRHEPVRGEQARSEPVRSEPLPNFTPGSPLSAPSSSFAARPFDVASIRRDFPILSERVNGKQLVWLDNAATTQKPQAVIDRLSYFYAHENSNIHRAAHTLAARATDAYEGAREKVRRFLNAPSVNDIVFTRGTTEAINLVAQSWGRRHLREGDEIVITWLEHHSNIVPWQMLARETGAKVRVAPVDETGQVRLDEYERLFNGRTRLVAFTHVSNALGTITPVREMIAIARRYGARVLVDGAQAVSHVRVDVQALDCDFYVLSGHKVFAPTGIGALYGKSDVLDEMPAWQGGGNMIADVTFDKTVFNPAPFKFEAGTGNIADAVGLGAALDYLERLGMENVARHEHDLLLYGTERLLQIDGLRIIGTAREKASVMSFVLPGMTSEQIGQALAQEGIAVRSGHHCAQPILRRFGLENTVRPSLALYNDKSDIDALIDVLKRLKSSRLV